MSIAGREKTWREESGQTLGRSGAYGAMRRHVASRRVTSRHVTSRRAPSNGSAGTNLASGCRCARPTIAINRRSIGRHVTHVRESKPGSQVFLRPRVQCPALTDRRNPRRCTVVGGTRTRTATGTATRRETTVLPRESSRRAHHRHSRRFFSVGADVPRTGNVADIPVVARPRSADN